MRRSPLIIAGFILAGLGAQVADQAMVEQPRVGGVERRRRGGADVSVEQHRNRGRAGGVDGGSGLLLELPV